MALSQQFVIDLGLADEAAYFNSKPAGFEMSDEVEPPYGATGYALKSDAGGTATVLSGTGAAANSTYVWRVGWFRFDAPVANGEWIGIAAFSTDGIAPRSLFGLRIIESGGSNYIRLIDNALNTLGTGGTHLAADQWHMIIMRMDSTAVGGDGIDIWVNGVSQIAIAGTEQPDDNDWTFGNASLSQVRRWWGWQGVTSATITDLDGTADYSECYAHIPEGAGNYNQYGDQDNCNSTDGVAADWDDWAAGGTNDGATTYCCGLNSGTIRQTSEMEDHTYSNTVVGANVTTWQKADIAGKNVHFQNMLRESATDSEGTQTNEGGDSFTRRVHTFPSPPTGNWSDANKLDDCEAGQRRDQPGDGADLHVTALAMIGGAIGTTGPGAPEEKAGGSPTGVAIGSANPLMIG